MQADQHWMEEVALREVRDIAGNMLKHIESSVNIARRKIVITCLGDGISERSTYIVILPGVLLVRMQISAKFAYWTLVSEPDMSLEMILVAIL
jgi:hypothetical protein